MKLRSAARSLAAIWLAAACVATASDASHVAKQARKAEKKGKIAQAYLLYKEASLLDPRNEKYRAKADSLERQAALQSNVMPSNDSDSGEEDAADSANPAEYFDNFSAQELAQSRKLLPPPELQAKPGRFDIDIQGDREALFDQVARIFGLETVFDGDYQRGTPFRFRLENAGYREALHGLEAATNSFVTPLSARVFMVAQDLPQKRQDLEQSATVTIPVPQALTSQEMIELAQAVRQVTGVEKIGWDTAANRIVLRDRVSRVMPALALFRDLTAYRTQVVVDLQLIEVTTSEVNQYGTNLPNMFTIAFTGNSQTTTTTTTSTSGLLNSVPYGSNVYSIIQTARSSSGSSVLQTAFHGLFPTSLSLFSISLGEAQALANFTRSVGKTMLHAQLRSTEGQAATFHSGDRYPILTGSYSVGTSVSAQYAPAPSFTFEDLGVTLKVTPHVHSTDDITLDVESEFKLLTGQVVNGDPVISNRKLAASVRLADDEWGVVAGLVQRSDSLSVTGIPGLSWIPWVGKFFQIRKKQKNDSELLIVMKPRLLSLPPSESITHTLRVGTDSRPYIPL